MTEKKRALRPRRSTAANGIPKDVADWFAGEPRRPDQSKVLWNALVYPGYELLHDFWSAWVSEHPDARPPAGYEWIAEPPPERRHGMPWSQVVAIARKCAARRKK